MHEVKPAGKLGLTTLLLPNRGQDQGSRKADGEVQELVMKDVGGTPEVFRAIGGGQFKSDQDTPSVCRLILEDFLHQC